MITETLVTDPESASESHQHTQRPCNSLNFSLANTMPPNCLHKLWLLEKRKLSGVKSEWTTAAVLVSLVALDDLAGFPDEVGVAEQVDVRGERFEP